MKRFCSKFRIGLITFAFGLASVFIANGSLQLSDEIPVNLPKTESSAVFEIITRENWKGFIPVTSGCGGRNKYGGESWATSYQTSDWKHVSVTHGRFENSKSAKKEIALRIGDASQVIERNKEKIILENQDGNTKWIDVIKYDGKKSLEITSSTSLELIIEFEEWQKLRK